MAGGRIKGLTVVIDGDTTGLSKALQGVNKEIKSTQSQLKDVDKLLKLDPGNTTLLQQKYDGLQSSIAQTKDKLETLHTAESQASEALARGDISKEQFDALQREIIETEQELKNLEQEYRNFGSVQAQEVAAACNNSALDVDSLSHAMSVAAPIFSSAGYSVNDAALYMGVMANNGIDADKAANSLKTGLARLVSPAKEGAEMMAQLGISVTNTDGSMKDSITIQKELHDAFSKLSESEQIAAASAIFGRNQMAPWLALINTAPSDVNELSESLENCAGTTDEMAEAMMSGFGGSLEKLKSSLDILVTSIGEALAPTIQYVADVIQKLVDKFNALSPAQQQIIVKIGLIVAAVGPLLPVVGKLLTAVGTVMTWAPKIVSGINTVVSWGPKIVSAIGTVKTALSSLWAVLITIMSSLAQEESRSISENATWGHRKRMADGKVSVPYNTFIGYDKGEDGNLVVNPAQGILLTGIKYVSFY